MIDKEIIQEQKEQKRFKKLVGEPITTDEKIIFVTRPHWGVLLYSFMCIIFSIVIYHFETWTGLLKNFKALALFLVFFLGGILMFFTYCFMKIILTNQRLIIDMNLNKKGITMLREIIEAKSSDFGGVGDLYLKITSDPKYFRRSAPSLVHVKKLADLINEQVALYNSQKSDQENSDKPIEKTLQKEVEKSKNKYKFIIAIICFFVVDFVCLRLGFKNITPILSVLLVIYLTYEKYRKAGN